MLDGVNNLHIIQYSVPQLVDVSAVVLMITHAIRPVVPCIYMLSPAQQCCADKSVLKEYLLSPNSTYTKTTLISHLTVTLRLQNLNVLMVGAKDGKGGFFPEGIAGRINTPEGFDALAEGDEDFTDQEQATQVGLCGCIPIPISLTTSDVMWAWLWY